MQADPETGVYFVGVGGLKNLKNLKTSFAPQCLALVPLTRCTATCRHAEQLRGGASDLPGYGVHRLSSPFVQIQLDAAIMRGKDCGFGAVCSLSGDTGLCQAADQ